MKIFKIFILVFLYNYSVLSGQAEVEKPKNKNYFGFELTSSIIRFSNFTKEKGQFTNFNNHRILNNNIVIRYSMVLNNVFGLNFYGGYFNSHRNIETSLTEIINNSKLIKKEYTADFNHSQYYFLILPEFSGHGNIQLYIKGGCGLSVNVLSDFNNSSKGITGLDGRFTRVKKLPDMNQTKIGMKLAFDVGSRAFVLYKLAYFNVGIRFHLDRPIRLLKNENIFISSGRTLLYMGLLFDLSFKKQSDNFF